MTNYLTSVGVQQFSITIASGSVTGTATITNVGSGAFILYGGQNPSAVDTVGEDFARLTLTNSTTITATRGTSTAGTIVINGCIIDGDTTNLIKSVQFGTITVSGPSTSNTATISAVTNANAAVHYLGHSDSGSGITANSEFFVLTLSGTTVTATRPTNGGMTIVAFSVIEFQGAALNQAVQNVAATSSSSVTSYTATITSVNTSNAIIIYAGSSIATVSTDLAEAYQYGSLTNSTTVTANVNTAVADAKKYNCSVVEFISGLLNSSVQRGTTTLTGVTSNTSTITGVTAANSLITFLGNTADAATAVINETEGAVALTNGTTVTVTKNSATADITASWEVAEFPAFIGASGTLLPFPWMNTTGNMQDMTGGMRG